MTLVVPEGRHLDSRRDLHLKFAPASPQDKFPLGIRIAGAPLRLFREAGSWNMHALSRDHTLRFFGR